jgi:hypothetical protein
MVARSLVEPFTHLCKGAAAQKKPNGNCNDSKPLLHQLTTHQTSLDMLEARHLDAHEQ